MSLRYFAEKVVHESHMAMSKWEKKEDLKTNTNTKHELRLYITQNEMDPANLSNGVNYAP